MTNKKCPKCGSRNFQIVDEYVQELLYEVEDGIVEAMGEGDGGEHVRTSCTCRNCGYHWHPRNLEYTIDIG